jgi:hypothetical protein
MSSDWSDHELKEVARRWLVDAWTTRDIGEETGKSKSAVHRLINKMGWAGHKGDPDLYLALYADTADTDELAPKLRPIELNLPKVPKAHLDSVDHVSLHWGDTHFPFEDRRAIFILYQIAQMLKPSVLVCHGDVGDLWQISDHRPPIEKNLKPHQIDLQETISQMAEHLGIMESVGQKGARKIYLEGNHEERWNRTLSDIQRHPKFRHLLMIPKISEVLNLPYLLGTKDRGWEYYPYYNGGDGVLLHDRLLVMHGYKSTTWVSRQALNDYGKSAMFGHSHRIQSFTKRDLAGTDAAWNIGCLCDINPHWRQHADWAQGFAVVTWKRIDGNWLFNTEQIRIHEGRAIWRDHILKG